MAISKLRQRILDMVGRFAETEHGMKPFIPGETPVPVSGRVYGKEELIGLVDASLDFWLTTGRFNDAFEKRLSDFLGVKHALTVNSGSSANLLAVAALTSPQLGERSLNPNDEVITVAAAFPTTVNPLLIYGLLPVFVDVRIPTYNIDPDLIDKAVTERTRAIVLAHTLGNPFHVEKVMEVAEKYKLWVIEDCCDALGSGYKGRMVGTFGDIGTLSFYPAHHITTGEGGAIFTNDGRLRRIIESLRDWGRDCYCAPGKDNTCAKRFNQQLGDLPIGYDHKYIYSHLGYNLKMTDMQAAVGVTQMEKLPSFTEKRRHNFRYLREGLSNLEEFFVLPEATPDSDPSWFGFPLTIRDKAPFKRDDLLLYLNQRKIATRLLFAGNIIRQPYFRSKKYRVSGDIEWTDVIMNETFWIGVYPGLTREMLDYVIESFHAFLKPLI